MSDELEKKIDDVLTPFAWIVTLGFIVLSYLRLYFGVDLSDEAHYVGIILSMTKQPNFESVVLAFRHFYFAFSLITFVFSYLYWRTKAAKAIALFISAIPLTFIYLSVPTLSHNTLSSHIFGIAMYAGLLAVNKKNWKFTALSIPFFILSALAYALSVRLTFYQLTWSDVWIQLLTASELVKTSLPQIWILLALLVLYLLLPTRLALKNFLFLILLLLLFVFGTTTSQQPSPAHLLFAIGNLVVFAYLLFSKQKCGQDITFLGITCFVLSFTDLIIGRDNLYSTAITGVFGFQVFIWLFTQYKNTKIAILPIVFCLSLISFWSYSTSNHEDRFANLNTKVQNGPYKGLLTSEAKRDYVTQIQYELSVLAKTHSSVLFYDNFPAGYLMTTMSPRTPDLFMQFQPNAVSLRNAHSKFFENPENLPDIVYDFKLIFYASDSIVPINTDNANPFNDPMKDYFFKRPDYRLIGTTEFYRVFERQAP